MSEPIAGEVLEMLADYVEISQAWNAGTDNVETAMHLADTRLSELDVAHLRALANALTPPAPASAEVEIINPQGRVAYRRPLGHPDVLEALQRPGYSVRKAEEGEG